MPTFLRPNGIAFSTSNNPDSILDQNGSAPMHVIRALANFSGLTMVIRAGRNITDITYNGVGNYRVNFTVAMPYVDFTTICTASQSGLGTLAVGGGPLGLGHTDNTAQIRSNYVEFASASHIWVIVSGTSASDPEVFCIAAIA